MSEERKHITVDADRVSGEWNWDTIAFAGTVDLQEHMGKEDTYDAFHTMHYLTPEIRAGLPESIALDVEADNIIAVTIRLVDPA